MSTDSGHKYMQIYYTPARITLLYINFSKKNFTEFIQKENNRIYKEIYIKSRINYVIQN